MRERAFSNSITPSHYVIAHANVPGLRVCSLYAETSLLLSRLCRAFAVYLWSSCGDAGTQMNRIQMLASTTQTIGVWVNVCFLSLSLFPLSVGPITYMSKTI